ncbi:MAG: endonuclease III [Rickettsiales bacterium]
MLTKLDIKKIFELLEKNNPNPKIELYYTNNFTLLIAVILSARATDVSVNKVTKELFNIIKTPYDLLQFEFKNFLNAVKTIGLYITKTNNIYKTAKVLIDEYNGIIPNSFEELIKLPGVGRKSANVIMSVAFGYDTIAVDTHVNRVSKRIGFTNSKNLLQIEQDLMQIVPKEYLKNAHHWLVLHGRYICKAIKPKCNDCILNKICLKRL